MCFEIWCDVFFIELLHISAASGCKIFFAVLKVHWLFFCSLIRLLSLWHTPQFHFNFINSNDRMWYQRVCTDVSTLSVVTRGTGFVYILERMFCVLKAKIKLKNYFSPVKLVTTMMVKTNFFLVLYLTLMSERSS